MIKGGKGRILVLVHQESAPGAEPENRHQEAGAPKLSGGHRRLSGGGEHRRGNHACSHDPNELTAIHEKTLWYCSETYKPKSGLRNVVSGKIAQESRVVRVADPGGTGIRQANRSWE
jgi:hypothetical protein